MVTALVCLALAPPLLCAGRPWQHNATVLGCQHARPPEQLPGQTHRALIQSATGSPPLRSFFFLQALPVATITPSSVCTHPHYTMQVLIMTNLPTANSSSFESKTFLHKGGGQYFNNSTLTTPLFFVANSPLKANNTGKEKTHRSYYLFLNVSIIAIIYYSTWYKNSKAARVGG